MESNDLFYNDLFNKYNNLNHKNNKNMERIENTKIHRGNKKVMDSRSNRKQLLLNEEVLDNDSHEIRPKIINNSNSRLEIFSDSKDKSFHKEDPFSKLLIVNSSKHETTKNKYSTSNLLNINSEKYATGTSHNTTGFKATKQLRRDIKLKTNCLKKHSTDEQTSKENRRRSMQLKEAGSKNEDTGLPSRRKDSKVRFSDLSNVVVVSRAESKKNLLVVNSEKKQSTESLLEKPPKKNNKTIVEADENIEKDALSVDFSNKGNEKSPSPLKIMISNEDSSKIKREASRLQTLSKIATSKSNGDKKEQKYGNGISIHTETNNFNDSSFDSEKEQSVLHKITQSDMIKLVEQSSDKLIESVKKEHLLNLNTNNNCNLLAINKPNTNTNATRGHKLMMLDEEKDADQALIKQQKGSFMKEVTTMNKYCEADAELELISIRSNTQYLVNFNNSIGSIPGNIKLSRSEAKCKITAPDQKIDEKPKAKSDFPAPRKDKTMSKKKLFGCLPLCY